MNTYVLRNGSDVGDDLGNNNDSATYEAHHNANLIDAAVRWPLSVLNMFLFFQ